MVTGDALSLRRPTTSVHSVAVVGIGVLAWVATPGAEMRWIDTERSTLTVYVSATGSPREGTSGYVLEAPLAEGSLTDTDTPHLALVINVDELRVVDPGRLVADRQNVRMQLLSPEGLDAEQFSRITYHSLKIDQAETGAWFVKGELEMHGRFLPVNITVVRQGDRFTGTTTVFPTDFGIQAMRLHGDSAIVGQQVRIDFDIVLEAS